MDKNVIEMAIESFPEYKDILPAGTEAVLLVEQSGQDERQVCERISQKNQKM